MKFGVGFGEDIGEKILKDKKDKREKDSETAWQAYQRKRKEKRSEKKHRAKQDKKEIKRQAQDEPLDPKKAAELELLVSNKRTATQPKPNIED